MGTKGLGLHVHPRRSQAHASETEEVNLNFLEWNCSKRASNSLPAFENHCYAIGS
jgi:hypothetical protein